MSKNIIMGLNHSFKHKLGNRHLTVAELEDGTYNLRFKRLENRKTRKIIIQQIRLTKESYELLIVALHIMEARKGIV